MTPPGALHPGAEGRSSLSLAPARGDTPSERHALRQERRSGGLLLASIAILGGIAALLAADLLSDYRDGHGPFHFLLEIAAGGLALVGMALFARHAWHLHGAARTLARDLRASETEARRWRGEARQALEELAVAIDREFTKWDLTDAERNVALMLLQGLSHRDIATARGTNEGTVRQQALAIYRKAGLTGRSGLAAFFLEGLALPRRSAPRGR